MEQMDEYNEYMEVLDVFNMEKQQRLRELKMKLSKEYYARNKDRFIMCEVCNVDVRFTEYKKHFNTKKHLFCCLPKEEQDAILLEKQIKHTVKKREQSKRFYDLHKKKNNTPNNISIKNISV
jgi:hypothetical protein